MGRRDKWLRIDQSRRGIGFNHKPSVASPATKGEELERLWNVPYERNPFFTGREEILFQLHTALKKGSTAAITQAQAINGLGGIGKTQTAVEYAYRYRDKYQHIFWTKADTHLAMTSGFV